MKDSISSSSLLFVFPVPLSVPVCLFYLSASLRLQKSVVSHSFTSIVFISTSLYLHHPRYLPTYSYTYRNSLLHLSPVVFIYHQQSVIDLSTKSHITFGVSPIGGRCDIFCETGHCLELFNPFGIVPSELSHLGQKGSTGKPS